jgi:integrase
LRLGDLRLAKREDIDFDKAEWVIATGKTKTPHITPLSKQALSPLKALRPMTELSLFVFSEGRASLEKLGFPEHLIEHQVSQTFRDPIGRAHNRTTFLEGRREMMQSWADFLDQPIN